MLRSKSCLMLLALAVTFTAGAGEPVDWEMVSKIREEGFNHSQVMDTIQTMADGIGSRLTGSPAMKEANEWTRSKLEDWGLENAHLEGFDFGRGWSYSYTAVHLLEPREAPLLAVPKAWTPGTKGKAKGEVMAVKVSSKEDLEKYKGKLKGKILLIQENEQQGGGRRGPGGRPFNLDEIPLRFDDEQLEEMQEFQIPTGGGRDWRKFARKRGEFRKMVNQFLEDEKALATLEKSSRKGGVLRVGGGGSREKGESVGVPAIVLAVEHFTLLERLLEADKTVKLEIEVKARFHDDDDGMAYNTIAEIPGTGAEGEIVMAGAHLDSWHAATGATDNGASCAVVMEAVRILKAIGVEPKRTIRVGLWSGEEQGLLGSRAYVKEHFASPPEPPEGEKPDRFADAWPLTYKPDHDKFSAYFNMDNGGGRFRGIYAQENAALKPVFEAWLKPFHDIGATTVSMRNTSGTDHLAFDSVGLPGFQFIQDQMDYFKKTHHTNLDTMDYLDEADLKQASVILASFLYHAAMRDEMMPRKGLPREPEKKKKKKGGDSDDEGGNGPPGYHEH